MTFPEALAFVQEAGWLGSRPGLARTEQLMDFLGHPERDVSFIHIAGTNGKGSTAAMLASILKKSGYRTGLFTSPHLLRYQERIQIDGREIGEADFCATAQAVKAAVERMPDVPTEFERFTAMAFLHFAQKNCEAVVLETGMGGRLDSTNVVPPPALAVITGIGLDHTEYLGTTLAAIAGEKAGIIKSGSPVVLAGGCPEAEAVVQARCKQLGCSLTVTDPEKKLCRHGGDIFNGQEFDYMDWKRLRLKLLGTYQCENAAVAIEAAEVLRARGWHITPESLRQGLWDARWPGRFEVMQNSPLVLVDGAHNPQGAKALADSIQAYLPRRPVTFVMGVLRDKDYAAMLDSLSPFAKGFITVTPDSPRAMAAEKLTNVIESRLGIPAMTAGDIRQALALALDTAGPEDVICACGSLYQAGEVRAFFQKT